MSALRVLFIGGNGVISSAVSRLAVERGVDLTLLTRGSGGWRPPIEGAAELRGDARDTASVAAAVGDATWDAVVNFQLFDGGHAREHVELFAGRTRQYVFVSTAMAYEKPIRRWPIVESAPQRNPWSPYAQGKIAAEEAFRTAWREDGFPVTVVRPSHTYDASRIPLPGGWTTLDRMRRGVPVVLHGDGTSLWTLTHQRDFARGLVGLLGRPDAIGEAVHITTDLVLTWDQVAEALADALGVTPRLVHVASETLVREIPEWTESVLGDFRYTEVYDNAKIKRLVPDFVAPTPFSQGAREIVAWHLADPSRQAVDAGLDERLDAVVARYGA